MIDRRTLVGFGALFGSMWPFKSTVAAPALAAQPDKSKVTYTIEFDCDANAVSRVSVVNRGIVERYAKLSDFDDVVRMILQSKSNKTGVGRAYFVIEVPGDWAAAEYTVPVTLSASTVFLSSAKSAMKPIRNGQMSEEHWREYLAETPEVGSPDARYMAERRDVSYKARMAAYDLAEAKVREAS